jgi:hypothetical protein
MCARGSGKHLKGYVSINYDACIFVSKFWSRPFDVRKYFLKGKNHRHSKNLWFRSSRSLCTRTNSSVRCPYCSKDHVQREIAKK